MMKRKPIAMTFSLLCAAGIASNALAEEQPDIDCSTASQDIAHLQHEKKSADERKVKGVLSIMPIGIAVNAATGGFKKADPNKEMEIEEYNKRIDARIADIKQHCNIEEPENPAMQSN